MRPVTLVRSARLVGLRRDERRISPRFGPRTKFYGFAVTPVCASDSAVLLALQIARLRLLTQSLLLVQVVARKNLAPTLALSPLATGFAICRGRRGGMICLRQGLGCALRFLLPLPLCGWLGAAVRAVHLFSFRAARTRRTQQADIFQLS